MVPTLVAEIVVSYGQVAVFDSQLADPFNEWDEDQMEQGFSRRERSVSFVTLQEDERARVEVFFSAPAAMTDDVVRAIRVPLTIAAPGVAETSSITGGFPVQLGAGRFDLVFHALREDSHSTYRFYFSSSSELRLPEILRRGAYLADHTARRTLRPVSGSSSSQEMCRLGP